MATKLWHVPVRLATGAAVVRVSAATTASTRMGPELSQNRVQALG